MENFSDKITVAKTAGFCFGVNRAIEIIEDLLSKGEKVFTLGPIIHNPQMVENLRERGVSIANDIGDVTGDAVLVIRSHGVDLKTIEQIENAGIRYVDATCPFVSKIHKIVDKASKNGEIVLIAGNKDHPEVLGIKGHCSGESYVFKDEDELRALAEKHPEITDKKVTVVSQTTHSKILLQNCYDNFLKKVFTNSTFFDTICLATAERQDEAIRLSQKSDLMIIIGGKQSSNTAKLRDVCIRNCPTYLVETADELPLDRIKGAQHIGVTAGASTPAYIIKEVLTTMAETINSNLDENFAEMLEESFKNANTNGKVVKGTVMRTTATEVYVDVGRKQFGLIELSDLTDDPAAKPDDIVKVGDELDLVILRTNDQEGLIYLSKKLAEIPKAWNELRAALADGTILEAPVTRVNNGGLNLSYKGVRVFVPRSHASLSRGDNLDELEKKTVRFKVIEINDEKKSIIGSVRNVLSDEKKALEDAFWASAEVGKHYTGTVKSLTSYGAFVDIGGVDGMIHISQLSWARIKAPSDVVSVGDTVDVYIKSLDPEKKKISLGYKDPDGNPWELLKNNYPIGTVVEGKVVNLTTFGAFVNILPSIDGLVHISQIALERIEKPADVLKVGETIKAVLTDVDFEKRRVSLSIRKLLEEEAAANEAEAKAALGDELTSDEAVEAAAEESAPVEESAPAAEESAE
ncbi:MAG: bifunctional 4-hydroxy-3-methylbut-2-enyl diphosphate reductase/30S ribosomal protein S1 [Clostridia bacterium]|nr:bifunctional 4-hydroxy-3-methylbut-2-enyl diphosphate reductase/30S ribosomal protein S1 [Clostridia bacterium]